MKLRIYVAGGSTERLTVVRPMIDRLKAEGVDITHDWTQCEGYDRSPAPGERIGWARQDLRGVEDAHIVWVMVPKEPSTGAAVEMGAALVHGTPIIVSGRNGSCIFYDLCLCFDTHEEALAEILRASQEMIRGTVRL